MAKKELRLHAVVSPTPTVIVAAYGVDGKSDAFKRGVELRKLFGERNDG